ncbi:CHAT domain-containing protein [Dactylosporangium sucinum]|uniref:CHAT domain-containing protein n=1 Tax=Dactylosporangium sucinum TaxID=1424081 RepID=A0A917WGW4_9ACTN|nr:CHAT domain-containing protein [Dactylosporangium sucinum]GGM03116.1 hypothetical protein GCM10007977_000620 [Dactylosporangium sucinum]
MTGAAAERIAVVLSEGDRHAVLVTRPPAPELPPDFLDGLWRQGFYDAPVLLLVAGDEDGFGVLPYRLPPGGVADLAADALRCLRDPVAVRGPYRVSWTPLLAYVLVGHFAGQTRRLGIVTVERYEHADEEYRRVLFHETLAAADPDGVVLLNETVVAPGERSPLHRATLDGLTTAEYGRALLESLTRYRFDGLTYFWVAPDDVLGNAIAVRRGLDEPVRRVSSVEWPPTPEQAAEDAGDWDEGDAFYVPRYRANALDALDDDAGGGDPGRLADAFDAFSYYVRLVRPAGPEQARAVVQDGLAVCDALLRHQFPHPAEWVAEACAALAARFGLFDEERGMLRKAAIACEYLGLFDRSLAHYQRALDRDAPFGYPWLERNLHLSYATTCAAMLAGHEPDNPPGQPLAAADRAVVTRALAHLDEADRLAERHPEGVTEWAVLASAVHRWRLRDLLGEHRAAADALAGLAGDPRMAAHEQLRGSAVVFRLAALKNAADESTGEEPYAELDRAVADALAEDGQWGVDRFMPLLAFDCDERARHGEHFGAFAVADRLRRLIAAMTDRQARTPVPGERHGGAEAIDALARMCRAWRGLLTDAPDDPHLQPMVVLLTGAVESAKSRWLAHDLTTGAPVVTYGATAGDFDQEADAGRLAEVTRRMREDSPARRHRWDEPFGADAEIMTTAGGPVGGRIADLREQLPEGSGFMSFYATRTATYVTVYSPAQTLSMELPVERAELERAVAALQAGFSGTGLYGRIDPDRPFDLPERFIDPVRSLNWRLTAAVAVLRDCPMVVVAPHGAWHNIPVHALILPQLWDTGRNPALCYMPSLSMAVDLFSRAAPVPATAAIATFPRAAAEEPLFLECHRAAADTLRECGPAVDDRFGRDVTPDEVRSMLERSDLLHVLAHGQFRRRSADVMDSGLALSPGATGAEYGLLTGAGLGEAQMRGTHLTVQACSTGRLVASTGDELWGLTRSAFLAGADSVLAPMWDVDLHSSTRLLQSFYRRWLGPGQPEGRSKAQAFTEAQRELYLAGGDDAWRHMYHWAAFKLMGA